MITFKHHHFKRGGTHATGAPIAINPKNDPFIRVYIYDGESCVGDLAICKTIHGFWETHGGLYSYRDHNKGYGLQLYSEAIRYAHSQHIEISSSSTSSDMARRLWNSKRLQALWNIQEIDGRFRVFDSMLLAA